MEARSLVLDSYSMINKFLLVLYYHGSAERSVSVHRTAMPNMFIYGVRRRDILNRDRGLRVSLTRHGGHSEMERRPGSRGRHTVDLGPIREVGITMRLVEGDKDDNKRWIDALRFSVIC